MNRRNVALLNNKVWVFFLLLMLLASAAQFYYRDAKTFDIQCESFISYRSEQSGFSTEGTVTLDLRHNALGEIGVEGTINKAGQTWRVNRDAAFAYRKLNNNAFKMEDIRVVKSGGIMCRMIYLPATFSRSARRDPHPEPL